MGGTYFFAIKYRETRKLKWERMEDRLCQGCIPSFKSKKKNIYIFTCSPVNMKLFIVSTVMLAFDKITYLCSLSHEYSPWPSFLPSSYGVGQNEGHNKYNNS